MNALLLPAITNNIYVQTTLPSSIPAAFTGIFGLQIAGKVVLDQCTSGDYQTRRMVGPNGQGNQSYLDITYAGQGSLDATPIIRGFIKRIAINVIQAYAGANNPATMFVQHQAAFNSSYSANTLQVTFDIRQAGYREFNAAGWTSKTANDTATYNSVTINKLEAGVGTGYQPWLSGQVAMAFQLNQNADANDNNTGIIQIIMETDQGLLKYDQIMLAGLSQSGIS